MNIIKVTQDVANQKDFNDWLDLALQLWPDCTIADLIEVIQSPRQSGFLVRTENRQAFSSAVPEAIALMNLSLRHDYVPDATQSPVAYVEGLYVKAEYRKQGVGTALIQYAEQWALEQGCIQLALDALLDNPASHEFYAKVGFREVERVVFFIKSIDAGVGVVSPEVIMASESVSVSGPVDIESSAKQPVASTDDLSSQQFYHGTRADLKPGDLIEPGYPSNYTGRRSPWVYFSKTLHAATWGAELAKGEGPGRIYLVEPTGPIMDDPNLTDKKYPGNPTKSYRSQEPLRVVGEYLDWQGHSPEEIQAMKDGIAGLEPIDD